MTRTEKTGIRSLKFSNWIRENLPDSSVGYLVSDLDFVLYNYKTKKIMLLEVKTHGAKLSTWQELLFRNLDKWLRRGMDQDWQYLGFHVITFGRLHFGKGYKDYVLFDYKKTTEEEIKRILSF